MKILVTGTAGFIGSFTAARLADRGDEVLGLDSINDYYDINIKYGRLEKDGIERSQVKSGEIVQSTKYPAYRFVKMDLQNRQGLEQLFSSEHFDRRPCFILMS